MTTHAVIEQGRPIRLIDSEGTATMLRNAGATVLDPNEVFGPFLSYFAREPKTEPGTDFSSLTRDQLRVMAKERDIAGRGSMTKAQLVKALTS